MKDLVGRPFSTFELNPFLWIETSDFSQIQKRYLQLSREFHPDRVSQNNEDAQEKAEEISSQINFDFSQLRDFWKLLENVVAEGLKNAACPIRHQHQTPPEFALEYFELQEELAEVGVNSGEGQKRLQAFRKSVHLKLEEQENKVKKLAARFPFQGFGEKSPPWTLSDLLGFQDLLETLRYLRSFLRDIDSKITALK